MDAAVHDRFDERADIFVFNGAFVFLKAARIHAEGHGLVLQVAFTALVADRAIKRVVDEQKLHHPFPRFLHHRRVGENLRRLTIWPRAQILHAHGARSRRLWRPTLHLNQAHTAIAGNRQPLMKAEPWHLRPSVFSRLKQRIVIRNLKFRAINFDLGHYSAASSTRPSLSER